MTARGDVARAWSGIDVVEFGPYRESVHAALAARLFADPTLRRRLIDDPRLYVSETGFEADGTLTILHKPEDAFVFVVRRIPR